MIPALVLASALLLPAAAGAALQKKVLILGVDGTMPSALAVARTPNLNFLRSNGCYSDRAVTDPVTHSAACWSSMFTGVWGDKHKVQDPGNSFAGNRFDLFPSFMRRAETARPELNTLVYARWAPLTNVTQGADVNLAFSSDEAITVAACQQLTNANPDLFYSILLDVDSAGHSYGWGAGVTNYVKAIETADARIGRILGALTNRASFSNEDWLVVTLSDHGQHDSTTERSRVTFHILYGPAAARGPLLPAPSIVDVCATVLTHLGLPIDPAWNLDARVEGLAAPVPGFYTNLIRNGDGESNSGGVDWRPDRGVAWWWDTSGATLGRYDASNRFTAILTPGAPGRGSNFFLGGSNAATVLSQVVPLEVSTGDPGVDYTLSAWLGGISNRADSATLTARFLAADGALLGQRLVGPVTVADRGGASMLLPRALEGTLPAGVATVEFVLAFAGGSTTNSALADNLAFELRPRLGLPVVLAAPARSNGVWWLAFSSVSNRTHSLERSLDLLTWTPVDGGFPGQGEGMARPDSNAPAGRAFYRVKTSAP